MISESNGCYVSGAGQMVHIYGSGDHKEVFGGNTEEYMV